MIIVFNSLSIILTETNLQIFIVMKKHIRSFVLIALSIFLFTGSSITVFGQLSGYNISEYKNPVYRYQFLNTKLNLGTSSNNQRFGSSMIDYSLRQRSLSLNSSLYGDYLLLANSARYQGEQSISLDFGGNSSSNNTAGTYDGKGNTFRQSSDFRLNSSNRYYFKPAYFLEFSPSIVLNNTVYSSHYQNHATEMEQESETKQKNSSSELDFSLDLAVGKGRIEAVQDAQMACYILEDLNKLGSLKKSISPEDIEALATAITRIKATRFFDSRIQKIREMSEIDALLNSRGLKSSGDAAYFTSLFDNWNYANNPVRESGYRYFAGLSLNTYGKNQINTFDTIMPAEYHYKFRNDVRLMNAGVYAGFKHEKPLNLKWQQSLSARIDFTMDSYKETNQYLKPVVQDEFLLSKKNGPTLNASIGGSYSYYPTTRTSASAGLYYSAHYGNFDVDSDDIYNTHTGSSEFWSQLQLNFRINYYCSERLRLQISAGEFLYYQHIHNGESEQAGLSSSNYRRFQAQSYINATLIYSFL